MAAMLLQMDAAKASGFKSRSQMVRAVTEDWAASHLYCPACPSKQLVRTPSNTKAIDLQCDKCDAGFQLKGGTCWNPRSVPDGAHASMIEAIRSDQVPNLLLMQYSPQWAVRNLLLVPSFFFHESAIKARRPLSPTARRAGWVGCNILLDAIPPEGKLQLVSDGIALNPRMIRDQYRRMRPLAQLSAELRGWTFEVLNLIHAMKSSEFSLCLPA
jgi:type II restriction enzyme